MSTRVTSGSNQYARSLKRGPIPPDPDALGHSLSLDERFVSAVLVEGFELRMDRHDAVISRCGSKVLYSRGATADELNRDPASFAGEYK